jgi:hypothetical protein
LHARRRHAHDERADDGRAGATSLEQAALALASLGWADPPPTDQRLKQPVRLVASAPLRAKTASGERTAAIGGVLATVGGALSLGTLTALVVARWRRRARTARAEQTSAATGRALTML